MSKGHKSQLVEALIGQIKHFVQFIGQIEDQNNR